MKGIPADGISPYMDAATSAALSGGKAAMQAYGTAVEYSTKEDGSPVTKADLQSNVSVKSALAGTGYPVLSEEEPDSGERLTADRVWIVDPLDGTSDFVDRTGEFTIMVALVARGRPILGVINWPVGGVLYAAQAGAGAWRYEGGTWSRMSVRRRAEASGCVAVTSRSHFTREEREFVESLGIAKRRALGSSLKVAEIGCGNADVYVTFTDRMKEWDTAASHCIIHEAGGRMTDMAGNELAYNRPDVFHRNGILVTGGGGLHDYIAGRFVGLQ